MMYVRVAKDRRQQTLFQVPSQNNTYTTSAIYTLALSTFDRAVFFLSFCLFLALSHTLSIILTLPVLLRLRVSTVGSQNMSESV